MMTAFDLYTVLSQRGPLASRLRYQALAKVAETMSKILPASAIRGYAEVILNHPSTKDEAETRAHARLVISYCERSMVEAMDVTEFIDTGILLHVLAARGALTFIPYVDGADERRMFTEISDLLLKDVCFLALPAKPVVDTSTEPTVLTP